MSEKYDPNSIKSRISIQYCKYLGSLQALSGISVHKVLRVLRVRTQWHCSGSADC